MTTGSDRWQRWGSAVFRVTFALYATGDIVEELLESAQLAAGATPGERLDLDELAGQVVMSMTPLAESAGIHLEAVTHRARTPPWDPSEPCVGPWHRWRTTRSGTPRQEAG
jgi:hypothetical protein